MSGRSVIEPFNCELPPGVLEKIQNLVPSRSGNKGVEWEPWQDEILLRYWGAESDYRQVDIVEIVGRSVGTCRKRYEELIAEEE
jgi:hypothetical protein